MKKILITCAALLCSCIATTVIAGAGSGPDADWAGDYGFSSLTVTPIGTADWINDTAELQVGTTYSVDATVLYADDVQGGGIYPYASATTLELAIGSLSWASTADARDIEPGGSGEEPDFDGASYDFSFSVDVDASMLGETLASFSLSGLAAETGFDINEGTSFTKDMGSYDINVNEPVPEPSTILLFGAGLAGLVGFSRRKRKA
ncbi:PEP-CTERM sorting domain-containing protein [Desulforhopalus sp. IMCC35007]|uniref:PEP-CTERM sorting domain-containing protein n=1 Tax=Desulforhopalus sp. IMCC35007 TaxID=2569543 RepID=UPI0010AE6583|nr:PEP-CTERM sorting domain-containing protein [Desulforhopalus sp. IMCC35007]TKB05738.1 PEP-CTERM sorting domain-containing protein [Desulforhopalus sp. IMCC35007]